MDPIVTTMAELIDAFIAADRPAAPGRLGAFGPRVPARTTLNSCNSRLRRRGSPCWVFLAGVLLGDA